MERMKDSVTGYGLWQKSEPHGGHSYWTDENAIGFCFYDEGLTNPLMFLEILDRKGELQKYLEYYEQLKGNDK